MRLPHSASPAELRARAAELEAEAEGHLAHGRTSEALDLLAWAAEARKLARGGRNHPKRTQSWAVER